MIFLGALIDVRYDSREELLQCEVVIWEEHLSEDISYATENDSCEFGLLFHVDLVFDWF